MNEITCPVENTKKVARLLRRLLLITVSLIVFSVSASAQDTYFIDFNETFVGNGDWIYQGFTVSGGTIQMTIRFAADYAADAAVVRPNQLSNFINNRAFTGFGVFDNRFGTRTVNLAPGTYYMAARNQVNATNRMRLELDRRLSVPGATFHSYYFSRASYVGQNGGKYWQAFTVQNGFRYFLDGCNSGLETYVIPGNQINRFRTNQSFLYYTAYSSPGGDTSYPGLYEIRLPRGTYYIALRNFNFIAKATTFTMERWRVLPGFAPQESSALAQQHLSLAAESSRQQDSAGSPQQSQLLGRAVTEVGNSRSELQTGHGPEAQAQTADANDAIGQQESTGPAVDPGYAPSPTASIFVLPARRSSDGGSSVTVAAISARPSTASLRLKFTGSLSAEAANNATHYLVRINGESVPVLSVVYDAKRDSLVIHLSRKLEASDLVTVSWTHLQDAQGRALSGHGEPVTVR